MAGNCAAGVCTRGDAEKGDKKRVIARDLAIGRSENMPPENVPRIDADECGSRKSSTRRRGEQLRQDRVIEKPNLHRGGAEKSVRITVEEHGVQPCVLGV